MFVRDGWPRVYDFAVDADWHQLVLYNKALPTKEDVIAVPLSKPLVHGGLGLDPAKRYHAYSFWDDRFIGIFDGSSGLLQQLWPGQAKRIALHAAEAHPQFLSTNRHLMQGFVDLVKRPAWSDANRTLAGTSAVGGGEAYRVALACNGRTPVPATASDGAHARIEVTDAKLGLAVLVIESDCNVSTA